MINSQNMIGRRRIRGNDMLVHHQALSLLFCNHTPRFLTALTHQAVGPTLAAIGAQLYDCPTKSINYTFTDHSSLAPPCFPRVVSKETRSVR